MNLSDAAIDLTGLFADQLMQGMEAQDPSAARLFGWLSLRRTDVAMVATPVLARVARHEAAPEARDTSPVDIRLTYAPGEGVLLHSTTRAYNAEIKGMRYPRFQWGRSISAWYVPHSRDKFFSRAELERVAETLRKAGATVRVEMQDGERRSMEERVATARERAEERAERYAQYGSNAAGRAEGAFKRAQAISARFEFGQPILVGHHSEKGARADQKRMHGAMRTSVAEADKAAYWEGKTEGVERHAERMERPDVINRRIETLRTNLRGIERQLAGDLRYGEDGVKLVKPTGDWLARLEANKADTEEQITYWLGRLGAQGLRSWGPNDFRIGQILGNRRGGAGPVIRVGDKSATVLVGSRTENEYGRTTNTPHMWTNQIEYKRLKPTTAPDPGPPEPFEAKPATKHPNAALIDAIYAKWPFTVAKVRLGYKHAVGVLDGELNNVSLVTLEDLPPDQLLGLAAGLGLAADAKKDKAHPDAKLIRALYTESRDRSKDANGSHVSVRGAGMAALKSAGYHTDKKAGWDNSWTITLEALTDEQREALARHYKLDVDMLRGKKEAPKDVIGRILAFAATDPSWSDHKTIDGAKFNGPIAKAFKHWWESDAPEDQKEKVRGFTAEQIRGTFARFAF